MILAGLCYLASVGVYVVWPNSVLVAPLWLAGVLLVLALLWVGRRPTMSDKWDWLLLGAFTALAFVLRYVKLTRIPAELDHDFALAGLKSLELFSRPWPPIVGTGDAGQPLLYYATFGWSMRVFGFNLYGLMMNSVLCGTLCIAAIYLLGREIFGRRTGLIAAGLLCVSYTHIHFSRVILTMSATLAVTVFVGTLFRGLRTGEERWFALAGVSMGIGCLLYYAGRVGPVITVAAILSCLLSRWCASRGDLRKWLFFVGGVAVGFGPQAMFYLQNPKSIAGRGDYVTIFNPANQRHLMGKYGVTTFGDMAVEQVKRTFLTFHYYGDSSSEFGYQGPMVDAITGALLLVGTGIALRQFPRPGPFVLLFWVTSVLVLGGVLTLDPPDWVHLAIALPAAVVVAAKAGDVLWDGAAKLLSGAGTVAIGLLLFAVIAVVGWRNWQRYVDYAGNNAGPRSTIARYIDGLPMGTEVVIVREPFSWRELHFQFFNRGVPGRDVAANELQNRLDLRSPVAVILTTNHANLIPALAARYPAGRVETAVSHGVTQMYAFRLGPSVGPRYHTMGVTKPSGWMVGAGLALVVALQGLRRRLATRDRSREVV